MPEILKITNKYIKEGKVQITDGENVFVWNIKVPGAGTEMRMAQLERESKSIEARIKLIDDKIASGKATEDDLDKYDELNKKNQNFLQESINTVSNIFQDGTPENSQVKEWIERTPVMVLWAMFEDIKNKANSKNESKQVEPEPEENSQS